MRQKYRMHSSVKIIKSGITAIVAGTYSQLYRGPMIDSYSLYLVENGEIYNSMAWFHEDELLQIEGPDRDTAEEMIENYHFKNARK